jgi:hypothetical protein
VDEDFGRANAQAFDRHGWNYVSRETFDLFYPGYLDSWTTLSGAIGMTYETDGGGSLARRRDDETVSTLRDAVAHHFEAALATVAEAAKNRQGLLRDFLAFRRGAIEAGKAGKMRSVVLLPGSDPGRLAQLADTLTQAGIEVRRAGQPFTSRAAHAYLAGPSATKAATKTFPAGALVVDLAQPQGRLARALLEPDAPIEPKFVQEQLARRTRNEKRNTSEPKEGYEFYDTTAWSLPFAYGIEAFWTGDAPVVQGRLVAFPSLGEGYPTHPVPEPARVAYLFRYDRDAAAFLALALLQENFRLSVATRPLRAGEQSWPRGTLIVPVARNPQRLHERIRSLASRFEVPITAINSAAAGDDSSPGPRLRIRAGAAPARNRRGRRRQRVVHFVWRTLVPARPGQRALFDRSLRALRSPDALARFNVVILPEGSGYAGALGKPGVDRCANGSAAAAFCLVSARAATGSRKKMSPCRPPFPLAATPNRARQQPATKMTRATAKNPAQPPSRKSRPNPCRCPAPSFAPGLTPNTFWATATPAAKSPCRWAERRSSPKAKAARTSFPSVGTKRRCA